MSKKQNKKYLIVDTGVLSRFFTDNAQYVEAFDEINRNKIKIFITPSVKMELFRWIYDYKSHLGVKKFNLILQLIESIPIFHFDINISHVFVGLSKKNYQLGVPDLLVSSTSISKKIRVFTANYKDFKFVKGVKLYIPPNM